MVIFRPNFSVFLSFNTQLTHLNASNFLNFDPSNCFLPIASQSWCSGVSKMATYIYISCRFICSKICRTHLKWYKHNIIQIHIQTYNFTNTVARSYNFGQIITFRSVFVNFATFAPQMKQFVLKGKEMRALFSSEPLTLDCNV